MRWLDGLRARVRLLFVRRAESRMNDEVRLHVDMETEDLMRAYGLSRAEARRRALAAFGGVEKHKETLRDGRGLAWLSGLPLDLKLGARMLRKYPGLTLVGGLALAVAIGVGVSWYDVTGKFLSPTIPLPDGDRLVSIETRNTLTNEPEAHVARDFLEWRRELRTIEGLGAFRTDTRNLIVGTASPEPIRTASITATAFDAARMPPLIGRGLSEVDDAPGAPSVVVLGYDLWQRVFGGRKDVVGSIVKLGNTPTTVIGVMPKGFGYPVNHAAWTPLTLRASYAPLEGDAIGVIGRLAPGVSRERADTEVRALDERAAAAYPATHQRLNARVLRLGEELNAPDVATFAVRNLPVLLVLTIACVSVGTLVYAKTATRDEEIALRSALGAGRARIIGQLFVEALLLVLVAAAVGLTAANRLVTWVIGNFNQASGGVPFWITPGLTLSTIVYAIGLAIVSAAMVSVLPALKATRANLQSHLANRGAGGASLRFGRVWTAAMILQVTVTAVGIPIALEGANEARRRVTIRAAFPGGEYVAARVNVSRTSEDETLAAFDARRARVLADLQRRVSAEPGVVAMTFSDHVPGYGSPGRSAELDLVSGAPPFDVDVRTSTVGPDFFETFALPLVSGRPFHEGDRTESARTVVVNEAFARKLSRDAGRASPVGARIRYATSAVGPDVPSTEPWFEIVGVVGDLGLDPDEQGVELPYVFHAFRASMPPPIVMNVRVRDNATPLAAHLPTIAADIDASVLVPESRSMDVWIRRRDAGLIGSQSAALASAALTLLLSAMSLFSLVSVNVSRRRREIGVRLALGATRRHVLAAIVTRAVVLTGSGIAAGSVLLLWLVAAGAGPSGQPSDDVPQFVAWLGMTAAAMVVACLLACAGPMRRVLRIDPTDALKEA